MVTKKQTPAWREPRRSDEGRWLCTTAAGCDRDAVVQATVTCRGCDDTRGELEQGIARKRGELEQLAAQEAAIRDAVRAEDRDITDPEAAVLKVLAAGRQQVGGDVERLEAAAAAVAVEHEHPVFACDKHAK